MRHANDIAVTLTEVPQYYEPLFLERDHKGRTVSIVDEWCCGYVKGIDRDRGEPLGSAPPTPPYVRVRIRRFEKLG